MNVKRSLHNVYTYVHIIHTTRAIHPIHNSKANLGDLIYTMTHKSVKTTFSLGKNTRFAINSVKITAR